MACLSAVANVACDIAHPIGDAALQICLMAQLIPGKSRETWNSCLSLLQKPIELLQILPIR